MFFFCFAISIICVLYIFSLLLQRSWMSDVTYLKINLYLRMFHPLSTTGLIPVLVLLILNVRITRGIIKLQVGTQNHPTMHHIYVLQYHTVTPPNFRVCAWQKVLAKCLKICYNLYIVSKKLKLDFSLFFLFCATLFFSSLINALDIKQVIH